MLPLVVHLYVLALISVMTLNCRIHSYNHDNDDDDDDDDDIYILLRSVYLWCLQSYTSPEFEHISTPDHWACYEQVRSKMKVLKTVSIKLDSNKHRYHRSHVLYFFWQLLYETKPGLRIYRIMSNHCVYAHECCTGF